MFTNIFRTLTISLAIGGLTHAAEPVEIFPAKKDLWKQAGPGNFSINNNIATSEGGMGMWWFSGDSYGNATFDIEFSLPDLSWNSGIFVRFPDPGNDPWVAIRQGYECQINGDVPSKLTTGSIYDIQPPSHINLKKPGEWNRYQITTWNNQIIIVINGELVNVFTTQAGRGDKQGHIGLQNHDPKSKVQFKKVSVTAWSDQDTLDDVLHKLGVSRADWVKYFSNKNPNAKWFEKMDVGPVWSNVFNDHYNGQVRLATLKGLTLELSAHESIKGLFDTETLRLSSAYQGGITWSGTPWTGAHGGINLLMNTTSPIMQTSVKPGWADQSGSFDDKRDIKGHGNLAEDQARFKGHFRHGSKTILDYSVLGSRVLELPTGKVVNSIPLTFRQLDLAPCKHDRVMLVADDSRSTVTISQDGTSATIAPAQSTSSDSKQISVIIDRTEGDWASLSMGAPSASDAIDASTNKNANFSVVPGFVPSHPKSGTIDNHAVRLNDGQATQNNDDVDRAFFLADEANTGRIELNIGSIEDLQRIHIFSEHKGNRAPQNLEIYGAENPTADPKLAAQDLAKGGWKLIATADTAVRGDGGKHGVAIVAPTNGTIGNFQKLLIVSKPGHKDSNMQTFFAEIDVFTKKSPAPLPIAQKIDNPTYYVALKQAGNGAKLLDAGNGTVTLHIPASDQATLLTLGYASNISNPTAKIDTTLAGAIPAPRALEPLTHGGPPLFPGTIETAARLGSENDTWAVDTIELPLQNPWNSLIKPGGMDLFSDGDSAAICTWNGDVWIVKGLKGDWKKVQWRRFATGFYESLGLKIVDDIVYVNDRAQITRLHDRNKDGEADWYECFNNDVIVTANFHEFTFGLQTDANGNFYIVKGAPVLGGGRGFDKILPHNGTVLRISKNGKKLDVLATGLRAPGGLAVGPNGEITTGENEGTWQPCCKLNYFTGQDKFLGVEDAAHHLKGNPLHPPLCYLPMRVDNSGGGQVWVPKGLDWGLKSGELIHLSYGQSSLYRVLRQEVDGLMQGGVVRIPVQLESSAMRARYHADGSLYTLGFRGWQTNAAKEQAFHRIRYTGKEVTIPDKLEATDKGIFIRFEKKLDPASVQDRFNFKVERWKYIRSRQYGSGEFSIDNPDINAEKQAHLAESQKHRKHDQVEVANSTLLPDGKTIFLSIPSMKPAEQMSIAYTLKFVDGGIANGEIINTVHKLAKHLDDSLNTSVENTNAAPKDLQPGLHQTITHGSHSDHRIARLPAQFNAADDAVSDMLGRSKGAYSSTWTGYLVLTDRVTPEFSLEGLGAAELKINGVSILKEDGKLGSRSSAPLQLNPGSHRFELVYKSSENGAGHIRLLWKAETFPQQSVSPTHFKYQPTPALTESLNLRHGRDVLVEQNCLQCHNTDDKSAFPELADKGPDMNGIGSRVNEKWLSHWLASPHSLKPNTKMPAFVDPSTEQGRKDAADMAAFLATLKHADPAQVVAAKPDDAKLGGGHFHNLGCIACHSLPGQPYDAATSRIPLNNVSEKFTPASLIAFLKQPDKHHASIKMPNFRLSDDEARQISSYLTTSSNGKATPAPAFPAGDSQRGATLISANNCASCHDGLPTASQKTPSFASILGTSWVDKGCVSTVKSAKHPRLNLSEGDAIALEKFRANLTQKAPESLRTSSSHDFAHRQIHRLNCAACHEQDEIPALLSSLHSQSESLIQGIPQDKHHAVDQSRPSLTYTGEMLHTDYLESMINGTVKERPRPWLAMRMPSFGSRAALLTQGLAAQHGMPPSNVDAANLDPEKVKTGHQLIGSNGGFACTICHANGEEKPLAAFEVEGINFDQVGLRLRPGYFHRWMENPPSVTPSTKMPRYTTGNKSPFPAYDSDAQKQFDAMLEYFKTYQKK